jgi:hypothetical protein
MIQYVSSSLCSPNYLRKIGRYLWYLSRFMDSILGRLDLPLLFYCRNKISPSLEDFVQNIFDLSIGASIGFCTNFYQEKLYRSVAFWNPVLDPGLCGCNHTPHGYVHLRLDIVPFSALDCTNDWDHGIRSLSRSYPLKPDFVGICSFISGQHSKSTLLCFLTWRIGMGSASSSVFVSASLSSTP